MRVLVEKEAEDFLEREKFPVAQREFCTTPAEAVHAIKKLKFPVAMKVVSPKILHKTDAGGVVLDIKTESEIRKAFAKMKKLKAFKGVLIQKYEQGLFILLGLKKDPTFGHVVTVGSGGIYTEILKDVSFRVCPITQDDAEEMIQELRINKILQGYRGKKYPVQKIKALLLKLSTLSQKYPEIEELDINPLIVQEKNAIVVDARVVMN